MKVLVFYDMHGSLSALRSIRSVVKKKDPDLIICGGDITIFEDGLIELVDRIARLKKPVLMIPGNHESDEEMEAVCSLYDNVHYIHKSFHRIKNHVFLGWGGGGFAQVDSEFERFVKSNIKKKFKKGDKLILVTHGPPFKTKLDDLYGDHVGNTSYTKFIKKHKPKFAFSGHIHETSGRSDKMGSTKLHNPGPKGRIFSL